MDLIVRIWKPSGISHYALRHLEAYVTCHMYSTAVTSIHGVTSYYEVRASYSDLIANGQHITQSIALNKVK